MAFEQLSEFDYETLPLTTKYRFAEIEINQALRVFTDLYQFDPDRNTIAFNHLYKLLYQFSERTPELEEALHSARLSPYFRRPSKPELINYFLYNQQSYKTITNLTKSSPNTISKYRFQMAPIYYPIFPHWTEPLLFKWEAIKHTLNLWDQQLVHHQKL